MMVNASTPTIAAFSGPEGSRRSVGAGPSTSTPASTIGATMAHQYTPRMAARAIARNTTSDSSDPHGTGLRTLAISSAATTTIDRKNAAPVYVPMVGGCHSVIVLRMTGSVARSAA